MTIYVPEEYAHALTAILGGLFAKYAGVPIEGEETFNQVEREMVSEVYKYLYLNNALKWFPSVKKGIRDMVRLMDPRQPLEPLDIIAISEPDPVDVIVKGTFV